MMDISQNGCSLSFDAPIDESMIVTPIPGSTTRRAGTIDGRDVRMTGSFLLGFTEPLDCAISVNENRVTITGTVNEALDTMNLITSGIARGTCSGGGVSVSLSCTGNGTADFTR